MKSNLLISDSGPEYFVLSFFYDRNTQQIYKIFPSRNESNSFLKSSRMLSTVLVNF